MVSTTSMLQLFAFVHDHFLRTHKLLQLCGGQAPARSHRDARWRRRWTWRIWRTWRAWRTQRTRRRLGRRRWGGSGGRGGWVSKILVVLIVAYIVLLWLGVIGH